MGERIPVEVGQVRRKPSGARVRVALDQLTPDGEDPRWVGLVAVRNVETGRLSYPMRSTVERWEVVHDPR